MIVLEQSTLAYPCLPGWRIIRTSTFLLLRLKSIPLPFIILSFKLVLSLEHGENKESSLLPINCIYSNPNTEWSDYLSYLLHTAISFIIWRYSLFSFWLNPSQNHRFPLFISFRSQAFSQMVHSATERDASNPPTSDIVELMAHCKATHFDEPILKER